MFHVNRLGCRPFRGGGSVGVLLDHIIATQPPRDDERTYPAVVFDNSFDCMLKLAALARGVAAEHGGEVTAGTFRDVTGLGRKRAIQLLEYFDHVGLLRRVGDVHRLRSDSMVFQGEAA